MFVKNNTSTNLKDKFHLASNEYHSCKNDIECDNGIFKAGTLVSLNLMGLKNGVYVCSSQSYDSYMLDECNEFTLAIIEEDSNFDDTAEGGGTGIIKNFDPNMIQQLFEYEETLTEDIYNEKSFAPINILDKYEMVSWAVLSMSILLDIIMGFVFAFLNVPAYSLAIGSVLFLPVFGIIAFEIIRQMGYSKADRERNNEKLRCKACYYLWRDKKDKENETNAAISDKPQAKMLMQEG